MKNLSNFQNTRHVLIVDALRYTLLLEQKAFTSMCRALRRIENCDAGTGHPSTALALTAINAAWSIVDTVHRLHGLITQVPSLSQNHPQIQLFIRNTSEVEIFRHLYQHLNNEIHAVDGKTNPIMGVLSWVTTDPTKSITIFVGTGTPDIELHTIAFDRLQGEFAEQFLFSAGNNDVNLYKIHERCGIFRAFFDDWLNQTGHLSTEKASVGIIRFHIGQAI